MLITVETTGNQKAPNPPERQNPREGVSGSAQHVLYVLPVAQKTSLTLEYNLAAYRARKTELS